MYRYFLFLTFQPQNDLNLSSFFSTNFSRAGLIKFVLIKVYINTETEKNFEFLNIRKKTYCTFIEKDLTVNVATFVKVIRKTW